MRKAYRRLTATQIQLLAAAIHGPGYWEKRRMIRSRKEATLRLQRVLKRRAQDAAKAICELPPDQAIDLVQATIPDLTADDLRMRGLSSLADLIGTSAEDAE